ncbi:MAG: threo-3-hydroxy-L-aspartate ammonia-lyase [Ottowia sp.]|nr:threo-3-hydroxy-L-aspartate ammonia-lyase [Ottowia sp.]
MPLSPVLPTFADVEAAASRLAGTVHRTPMLTSGTLDRDTGVHFFFKCENLQRAGAFKFRGACHALARLTERQRRAGVVAFSSGNHAQAVALAAQLAGLHAVVVMPGDAPPAKLAATRGYGAEVVLYDRYADDREQIASELARDKGYTLIPPFDHPDVIAGQGTAALELLQDAGPLDAIFTPLGGGGLLSGTALAARALMPQCRVYGVEPEAGDDGRRSFRSGALVRIDAPRTIADGAQTQQLGRYTFPIILQNVTDIVLASDDELVACMRFFAERMKLVVEPTGCLGLAAARRMRHELAGARVGVIISGGNIDLCSLAALQRHKDASWA